MTIHTPYIVAPVFAPTEVVMFFLSGMTYQAGFRRIFSGFILERNNFCWVSFFDVRLAGTVARLATSHFTFPTGKRSKFGV
jgi:hypothetical protein